MDFFYVANQKTRRAINNFRLILNKIHLHLFTAIFWRLFPSFIHGISPFLALVIVKKQIDTSFLCICPVIDDKFCPNIVKA